MMSEEGTGRLSRMRAVGHVPQVVGACPTSVTLVKPQQCPARPGVQGGGPSKNNWSTPMHVWYAPLKIFALAIVLLMAVAMVYAGTMAITYWAGIGV